MYELRFDKKALENLQKLEKPIRERIWNKLQQCKQDSLHFLEHLTEVDGYKLRVGDYRAIIDLDQANSLILVVKIGHRKNIYDY